MNISGITKDSRARSRAHFSRFSKLLILTVAILLLAACAASPKRTPPPKTPPTTKPTSSTPVQPIQPVTSGTALVAPANHEREKTRIKALLAKNPSDSQPAAEVGYYMDVLQGRVKQKIVNSKGIGIARSHDRIVIVMTGGSGFEGTNHQISPGIREFLTPLSKILVEYRMTIVSVRIRVDSSGGKANNPQLTELRAQAVANYLADAGVSNKRMVVVGTGKKDSASVNSSSGSRERIELQIEPIVRAKGR